MKKILNIMRKAGILHASKGDYISGEYSSNQKKENTNASTEGIAATTITSISTKKTSKILLLTTIIIGTFFILAGLGAGTNIFFLMLILWGFSFFLFTKFNFSIWINITIILTISIVSISTFSLIPTNTDTQNKTIEEKQSKNAQEEKVVPEEIKDNIYAVDTEIYIEGVTGSLSNGGEYSRIGESARGGEAYLGDGGATAIYNLDLASAGSYTLYVNLTDDAMHASGTRNATISVNGTKYQYQHISEDTDTWKWYQIGNINLKQGINEIKFTKDKTTSAAYIMNAFKLTPN